MTVTSEQETLVAGHVNLAYSVVWKGYTQNPYYDTNDLIGIALWGLCKAASGYDESKGPFMPYAKRAISNAILNELRTCRNHLPQTVSMETPISEGWSIGDTLCGADAFESADMRMMMRAALKNEPYRNIKILNLYAKGYSQAEIAKAVWLSQPTVNKILKRMEQKIRAEYERGYQ